MKGILLLHLLLAPWIALSRGDSNCVTGDNTKIDKWKVTSILVEPFLMEGVPTTNPPPVTTTAPPSGGDASGNSSSNSTSESAPEGAPENTTESIPESAPQAAAQTAAQVSSNSTSDDPPSEDAKYSGYVVDILDKLAEALGVTYEISLVPDNRYGKKEGDKWNGLIGQVCDGKAHIAAAPITVTVDREEAVDFTYSLLNFRAVAVIQQPSEPINSLLTLLNSSYQLGITEKSPILKLMAESKAELTKRVYANVNKGLVESNLEGFKRVRKESNYAFIVEDTVANFVLKKPPCGLQAIPTNLYQRKYAFAVPQGSSLRDQINKVIVDWQIDGTLEVLREKWWGKNECSAASCLIVQSSSIISLSLVAVLNLLLRLS